jgi:hypothetical protein
MILTSYICEHINVIYIFFAAHINVIELTFLMLLT